eukprot:scaffold4674_cov84-Isochrysis_galbana.AAC.2
MGDGEGCRCGCLWGRGGAASGGGDGSERLFGAHPPPGRAGVVETPRGVSAARLRPGGIVPSPLAECLGGRDRPRGARLGARWWW